MPAIAALRHYFRRRRDATSRRADAVILRCRRHYRYRLCDEDVMPSLMTPEFSPFSPIAAIFAERHFAAFIFGAEHCFRRDFVYFIFRRHFSAALYFEPRRRRPPPNRLMILRHF